MSGGGFPGLYALLASESIPATGGNDANTLLLIHADGADGSGFSDASATGNTVSSTGSVLVSTSQAKFGSGSVTNPASNTGFMSVTPQSNFNFGTSDFTIDFWLFYPTGSTPNSYYVAAKSHGTYGPFAFYDAGSGQITVYLGSTGTSWDIGNIAGATFSKNAWHHHALVRHGSTFTYYLDGVSQGTVTSSASLFSSTEALHFAGASSSTTGAAQSYIDEIRVSNIARWTSNFTPPSAAYS